MILTDAERFDRLISRLKSEGIIATSGQLADTIKAARSHVSYIRRGKSALTQEFIARIKEAYPVVNEHFLATGLGVPLLTDDAETSLGITATIAECIVCYHGLSEFVAKHAVTSLLFLPQYQGGIAFINEGRTMEPLIPDGATVITSKVEPLVSTIESGKPYLIIAEGLQLIRLCYREGDSLILKRIGKDALPIEIHVNDVRQIAKVVAIIVPI